MSFNLMNEQTIMNNEQTMKNATEEKRAEDVDDANVKVNQEIFNEQEEVINEAPLFEPQWSHVPLSEDVVEATAKVNQEIFKEEQEQVTDDVDDFYYYAEDNYGDPYADGYGSDGYCD